MLNRLALLVSATAVLCGCQTAQQRREAVLRERVVQLRPLSTFQPAWCRVDVELTRPAVARYAEMYPSEPAPETLAYTWKAREASCEVKALTESSAAANYKSFLSAALCVLLQVHWVNSPFDELPYSPERLDERDSRLHLGLGEGASLSVDATTGAGEFTVETKTRQRGTLRAQYAPTEGEWLPRSLAQSSPGGTTLLIDAIEWSGERVGKRRPPRALWISVGEDRSVRHSRLEFSGCRSQ